ncbi:hypothetical protein [Streptomyces sp. NPDC004284]|uniref:hypothetical protein n=1 Tax=Streptomyces sp. NPDC004284 TaxID=3364695 RepID=UPI0036AE43EB
MAGFRFIRSKLPGCGGRRVIPYSCTPATPANADEDEATIATWRAARRAEGEAEIETEAALGHDLGCGMGEECRYSGQYDVGYAPSRRESSA